MKKRKEKPTIVRRKSRVTAWQRWLHMERSTVNSLLLLERTVSTGPSFRGNKAVLTIL